MTQTTRRVGARPGRRTDRVLAALLAVLLPAAASGLDVNITRDLASVQVMHQGREVTIQRNQDTDNTVAPAFAKTSRKCPPFCIQPMNLAPGVETIGEVELLDYLRRSGAGDHSVLVVDSRTPDWVARGTIPGSVNIPWTRLNPAYEGDPITVGEVLEERLGVTQDEGLWDFSKAKTVVFFCNGMWCGQSPNSIANLLRYGYPPQRIKWYRGGMQDWEILGLTTVKPAP